MKLVQLLSGATSLLVFACGAAMAQPIKVPVDVNVVNAPTVKAEPALPARPFQVSLLTSASGDHRIFGPHTQGTLAVSALTLTNRGTEVTSVQVARAQPTGGGTDCANASSYGFFDPRMLVLLAPRSTQHLTFPVPLVMAPINGVSCMAVIGDAQNLSISVNGTVH